MENCTLTEPNKALNKPISFSLLKLIAKKQIPNHSQTTHHISTAITIATTFIDLIEPYFPTIFLQENPIPCIFHAIYRLMGKASKLNIT